MTAEYGDGNRLYHCRQKQMTTEFIWNLIEKAVNFTKFLYKLMPRVIIICKIKVKPAYKSFDPL